ncbi:MAG TPA: DUF4239 domain-containing protein [Steroidobacteraceae bacterium]
MINVILLSITLGGLWIVRTRVLPRMGLKYQDAYLAAAVVQSVMLLYGLIAALTAVGVWQRYGQVSEVVSGEATAIAILWRDFGSYPQPLRDETREVLRGYTEQIVRDAWPQQRLGKVPREGVEWMDLLQTLLNEFEPSTESQKILHAETYRAFNQLVQQRRQRLDSVQAALPSVLWWVLLPGAVGCIVLFLFFQVANARFHAVLLVGLSGFLSMVLFVIVALDRPFSGDMGITADSYQLVIDHYMKR